jgi:hypothetical protein
MDKADKNAEPAPEDIKIVQLGGTTFEVVSNYVGEKPLLDVIKTAIKRTADGGL